MGQQETGSFIRELGIDSELEINMRAHLTPELPSLPIRLDFILVVNPPRIELLSTEYSFPFTFLRGEVVVNSQVLCSVLVDGKIEIYEICVSPSKLTSYSAMK